MFHNFSTFATNKETILYPTKGVLRNGPPTCGRIAPDILPHCVWDRVPAVRLMLFNFRRKWRIPRDSISVDANFTCRIFLSL